jgi:hypothetical protein
MYHPKKRFLKKGFFERQEGFFGRQEGFYIKPYFPECSVIFRFIQTNICVFECTLIG